MTTPLTPEREQYWREMARIAHHADEWPALADKYFVEGGMKGLAELLAELDRVRDELAEEKASHNPRLRGLLVKAAPDRDLYVNWSTVCDMPGGIFSRETALEHGYPRSYLDRADATGTSARHGEGAWDDKGWVAEQRGWLRRDRLGDYAQLWLADRQDEAFDLLEPFEGETEVRR